MYDWCDLPSTCHQCSRRSASKHHGGIGWLLAITRSQQCHPPCQVLGTICMQPYRFLYLSTGHNTKGHKFLLRKPSIIVISDHDVQSFLRLPSREHRQVLLSLSRRVLQTWWTVFQMQKGRFNLLLHFYSYLFFCPFSFCSGCTFIFIFDQSNGSLLLQFIFYSC